VRFFVSASEIHDTVVEAIATGTTIESIFYNI